MEHTPTLAPGLYVTVIDNGWTYSTYEEIATVLKLQNWKPHGIPKLGTYKIRHMVPPEYGRNSPKIIIEDIFPPFQQYIIGTAGVEYSEKNIDSNSELIEKNKAEKPKVYFDISNIGV